MCNNRTILAAYLRRIADAIEHGADEYQCSQLRKAVQQTTCMDEEIRAHVYAITLHLFDGIPATDLAEAYRPLPSKPFFATTNIQKERDT